MKHDFIGRILKHWKLQYSLVIAIIILTTLALPGNGARGIPRQDEQTDPFVIYLPLVTSGQNPLPGYLILGWNDLGMHFYNRDFQDLALFPPFNTLWAQVIQRGDPPQIITQGIQVEYSFPNNTYSVGKTNFWDHDLPLFGVDLPANTGLTGNGLAGEMDLVGDHFIADGIPLTEFEDSSLVNSQPYQLAGLVARDEVGNVLAALAVVAPVSTEMRCLNYHSDGGVGGIATGRVETNILTLHDQNHQSHYPVGHTGALMDNRPVLCAECHASNLLRAPGVAGVPNLSKLIHRNHAGGYRLTACRAVITVTQGRIHRV